MSKDGDLPKAAQGRVGRRARLRMDQLVGRSKFKAAKGD